MILPDSLDQIQKFEMASSFLIKQMVSVLLVQHRNPGPLGQSTEALPSVRLNVTQ